MRNFIYILFILNIICCRPDHKIESDHPIKINTIPAPGIITAGKPVSVVAGTPKPFHPGPRKKTSPDFFVALQNFNTDKGLALSSILCSCKDRNGNLWFGTDGGGVSRYDGKSFTNFTLGHGLTNNCVYCIHEDKNGNIWFGTNGGGVSRYDGISFTTFTSAQGITNNIVQSITELRDGKILFGTDNGVSIYDGKKYRDYETSAQLAGSHVVCITELSSGNLWFGTSDQGLFVCDSLSCINYTVNNGLADNNVKFILENKNGKILLGCNSGLINYDGSFKPIQTGRESDYKKIYCIIKDNQENILISSSAGVSSFKDNIFSMIASSEDLLYNEVKCITEDNSGNLWLGTYGGGLFLYSNSGCSSSNNIVGNFVNNIIEDESGTIWFATDNGVTWYDGTNLISVDLGVRVLSMAEDDSKNIWLGTLGNGVILYNTSLKNWTTERELEGDTVWVITKDSLNNIWLGTNSGVIKCDAEHRYFSTFTTSQGLSHNKVRCITFDSFGNGWFGTDGGGACFYNGQSFINFNNQQGLSNNSVYCITKDQAGNLWFGTSGGGISILTTDAYLMLGLNKNGEKIQPKEINPIFKNFTAEDSLANEVVYDIIENKTGDIIVGTNEGFTFLNGGYDPANNHLSKKGIEYFNQRTAYPIKDINVNAMYVDSKGIIWAGTGDKLVRFDYCALLKPFSKFTVNIQNLKLNNQNISWYDLQSSIHKSKSFEFDSITTPANITEEAIVFGKTLGDSTRESMCKYFSGVSFDSISRFYYLPVNLTLPCIYNNLTFDYAAIEPARPFLVRYQFMLEGYDKTWNPVTERTNASFGNLFEGKYTFRLKALSPEGVWSDEVNYSFIILPPWYRTWWAFSLYFVLFFTALKVFIKWRISKLKKEKEKLEIKVEKRTSELKIEKERSESLLLNILPNQIAKEFIHTGTVLPKDFEQVTVLFTDFKDFTILTERQHSHQLIDLLNYYFSAFDTIITKYGIEKIKTIGDSYMCAGGLPVENKTNPEDAVLAALEIRDFVLNEKEIRQKAGKDFFEIRIGLHTGPVVAGKIGYNKFAYDIWGDTVNIASRMQSSGETGKVNISSTTYELVKDKIKCSYRGKISAKNKGEIDMYFADSKLQHLPT